MSSRLLHAGYVLLALSVTAAGAFAQSLQDRKMQQSEDQMLAAEIAYTNQLCNSEIQASVDWQSFSSNDLAAGAAPLESCDAAFGAIESLCADQGGQEAVRQRVTRVECVKGTPREVTLKQGTLFFQIDGALSDNFQYVRDYLVGEVSGAAGEE